MKESWVGSADLKLELPVKVSERGEELFSEL